MSRPPLPVERHHLILERVAAEQALDYASLAAELGVSVMTVRRDVKHLEAEGFVRTTRGGATAHLTRSFDLLVGQRALAHAGEKRLIGRRAVELIEAGETIFLGIGSTAAQFAQFLPANLGVTVITTSLAHASFLASREVRVVSTGGLVAGEELSQTGALAERSISRFHATSAVLGAAGISSRAGVTELDPAHADLHRRMVERSERLIVLADGSKAGVAAPYIVCDLDQVTALVTDPAGSAAMAQECSLSRVQLIVAAPIAAPSAAPGSAGDTPG
jgi:DeoR/GlpR family transcriptional regulator of sugar metabolism